jgi:two-component sensor histidine kinase
LSQSDAFRFAPRKAPIFDMQNPVSQFQGRQLEVIARATPYSMGGHILNTTVLAVAMAGSIPTTQLIIWCVYSYAAALVVLYRHMRNRGRVPRNFSRAARRATLYAFFLALPWSIMFVLYLGSLPRDQELILVAIGVGMAASGTILLSAVPVAALSYMSGALIPAAIKSFLLLQQQSYFFIGVLALSCWWFLAALIAEMSREIAERKRIDVALKENEVRLQETLAAGQVVAFTWDPQTGRSQRSLNASHCLGLEPRTASHGMGKDFLARVHPDDRRAFADQVKGLRPENPIYLTSFRFVRPDGQAMWLEESGKADFDASGRCLRLTGLTADITDRKRGEEQQRMLARELDHRVKNLLASIARVAQRTREGSRSMDEYLPTLHSRIQSMSNAHALLSRSHWHGVRLAELAGAELAPFVKADSISVEGPDVLLTAEATQPMAIVLHELVTNASKYGALSTPDGRITVRWHLGEDEARLVLEWIEADGPPVVPGQASYGTGVIRNLIPYELGGTVDLAFAAEGLRCKIALPSKCLA